MKKFFKRTIIVVLILAVIYALLGFLDYKGLFVNGTYKYDDSSNEIVLKFFGEVDSKSFFDKKEEDSITYKVFGEEVVIYSNNEELMTGNYKNGVIKIISIKGIKLDEEIGYIFKENKTRDDYNEKSFIEYIKIAVNPLSSLFKKI